MLHTFWIQFQGGALGIIAFLFFFENSPVGFYDIFTDPPHPSAFFAFNVSLPSSPYLKWQ
jgi:hypothetical protein